MNWDSSQNNSGGRPRLFRLGAFHLLFNGRKFFSAGLCSPACAGNFSPFQPLLLFFLFSRDAQPQLLVNAPLCTEHCDKAFSPGYSAGTCVLKNKVSKSPL